MAQLRAQEPRPAARPAAHPFRSALLVLGGASLFGTVGTAQALGPTLPPEALAGARMLVTALVFVALAAVVGRGAGVVVAAGHVPTWLAGLGQGAFNLFFLAAMTEAGVAVGTLVAIGATPIVTGLITRRVSRLWAVATAIAVLGLVLLVGGQQGAPVAPSAAGVALALGAAVSYSTYIVAGNAAEARGLETQSFLAAAFSVSALVTLPWLLLADLGRLVTPGAAVLVAYLVLVPTILAYSLFNRGLRGVRSSTASTLALVEPVVAATLAYLLLGELLGATGLLGAALVLVGLVLVVRATATRAAPAGTA